jgi:hypothetical protein
MKISVPCWAVIRDALACSGPRARYTDGVNEFITFPSRCGRGDVIHRFFGLDSIVFYCLIFGGMENSKLLLCQNRRRYVKGRLCTGCIRRAFLFTLLLFGSLGYLRRSKIE